MNHRASTKLSKSTAVDCKRLPGFDWGNLDSIRRAFKAATNLPFRQAWRKEPEAGFSPGAVSFGWRGKSLFIFSELIDPHIFNRATGLNQLTWELGDVFEMLFKIPARESYVEFHVTPENQKLQLQFPNARAVKDARKKNDFADFFIPIEVFRSKTWIQWRLKRWYVCAEIPARAVVGSHQPLQNSQWRFSFGRYDYCSAASAPVMSSPSPHKQPDFHRQREWMTMIFQ